MIKTTIRILIIMIQIRIKIITKHTVYIKSSIQKGEQLNVKSVAK